FNEVFRSFFVVLLAYSVGEFGGIGFNSLLLIIFKPVGSVAVPVRCDTHNDIFVVFQFYAVKQGLKLGGIPRCVKQYNSFISYNIHSMRRYFTSFVAVVGGINVKVVCEL